MKVDLLRNRKEVEKRLKKEEEEKRQKRIETQRRLLIQNLQLMGEIAKLNEEIHDKRSLS